MCGIQFMPACLECWSRQLVTEHWIPLVAGFVLFMIGLVVRVRTEEKLLRSAFGQEFEKYAKRVPAVLPGIY